MMLLLLLCSLQLFLRHLDHLVDPVVSADRGRRGDDLLIEAVTDQDVQGVAGVPQGLDGLRVGSAKQRLAVDLNDALTDLEMGLALGSAPGVDLGDEDALVGGVLGVARLAVESALDNHAQLFVAFLDANFLKDANS